MWPIQTLTLLLCLTDDEQLFAQRQPLVPEPAIIEQEAEMPVEIGPKDLIWEAAC
jgi:hypothetical protein